MTNITAELTTLFYHFDKLARDKYPAYAVTPVPSLTFFTKGQCNGRADRVKWNVELNTHIAAQTGAATFANTVSHEIAHMVDYALRGRSGHDAQWKAIHRSLGGTASRCSQYGSGVKAIAGRRTNWYEYVSPTNGEVNWVGPKHHAALRRGASGALRNNTTGTQILAHHYTGRSKIRG